MGGGGGGSNISFLLKTLKVPDISQTIIYFIDAYDVHTFFYRSSEMLMNLPKVTQILSKKLRTKPWAFSEALIFSSLRH